MKKSLLILISLFITMAVISEPVSMLTARKVAQNYFNLVAVQNGKLSSGQIILDNYQF